MSNKVCAFYSLLLTQIAKLNRFIVNEIFNLNYVSNKLKFNDITIKNMKLEQKQNKDIYAQ